MSDKHMILHDFCLYMKRRQKSKDIPNLMMRRQGGIPNRINRLSHNDSDLPRPSPLSYYCQFIYLVHRYIYFPQIRSSNEK